MKKLLVALALGLAIPLLAIQLYHHHTHDERVQAQKLVNMERWLAAKDKRRPPPAWWNAASCPERGFAMLRLAEPLCRAMSGAIEVDAVSFDELVALTSCGPVPKTVQHCAVSVAIGMVHRDHDATVDAAEWWPTTPWLRARLYERLEALTWPGRGRLARTLRDRLSVPYRDDKLAAVGAEGRLAGDREAPDNLHR